MFTASSHTHFKSLKNYLTGYINKTEDTPGIRAAGVSCVSSDRASRSAGGLWEEPRS